jgi:hypothetical protein
MCGLQSRSACCDDPGIHWIEGCADFRVGLNVLMTPLYPLDRRMCGLQSRSACCDDPGIHWIEGCADFRVGLNVVMTPIVQPLY